MRLLVTGATGFIGSHLARHLVDVGHDVHAVVRPGSRRDVLDDPRVVLHEHRGSTANLVDVVGAAQPEAVFHLASLFLAAHGVDDVERLVNSNVLFGAQLLEAMAAHDVPLLVNAGTSWQHAGGSSYEPVCLYAATKQAFEDLVEYSVVARGLRAVTLKLFDTYGPRDPRRKLIHVLLRAVKTGEPLGLSPGEQILDLLHVEDAVLGFTRALERAQRFDAPTHERWALRGERCSLRQLVAVLDHLAPSPIPVEWGGRPYREREVMHPWDAACILPDWEPTIPLERGLSQLLHSWVESSNPGP